MKNIYKNLYQVDIESGNLKDNPRVKIMLEMADCLDLKDKTILDIGCYDGTFLSLLKNRGNKFFGLDASDWAIEQCRKKNIAIQQYFFDDKTPLPYEKNSFDLVVAGEIIEHIYDTDFFLEEISRVLSPEGKLLISTPNLASFGRRFLLLFGKNPLTEISPNEPGIAGHIRYFTFETLKRLLKKHKLKVIASESDVVNFSGDGKLRSSYLAKIFPRFGASVIMLCKKN